MISIHIYWDKNFLAALTCLAEDSQFPLFARTRRDYVQLAKPRVQLHGQGNGRRLSNSGVLPIIILLHLQDDSMTLRV